MGKKFRLTKAEMAGFILLLIIIFLIAIVCHYSEVLFSNEKSELMLTAEELKEIENFSQEIKADSIKQKEKYTKSYTERKAFTPFKFDPNTADSATLAKIGLRNYQINNIIKYRKKGGRWKKAEDFEHLYGLSKDEFKQLKPYISIVKSDTEIKREKHKAKQDSIYKSFPKKYEEGTLIALNESDTTALKGIPGIGSYYASKICRYRERLGGFISLEQLKEIEGLPENIERWFTLNPNPVIKQIKINETDFKGLVRHPYLNYEQVKVICNYIRKYGKIHSWEELSNNMNFTEKDFKRLEPYFSFN